MRLEIRPGLTRVWRAPGRLQFGLDSTGGVIIDGLGREHEQVLGFLDGSGDAADVVRRARRAGIPPAVVSDVLDVLSAAGVLVPVRGRPRFSDLATAQRRTLRGDAEALSVAYPDGDGWEAVASRQDHTVGVVGLGRTGLTIAFHLARAGVGTVLLDDDALVSSADVGPGGYREEDVGRTRSGAAAALLALASPATCTGVGAAVRPDLLVVVGHGAIDPRVTDGLLREDVAHLAVVLRDRDAVVGPLVRPGHSACLRCLDLHRRDRDPEWPRIALRLGSARPSRAREEASLTALAAAQALSQCLTHLDGRAAPASLDATLEVSLPNGLLAVRPWSRHPRCGCSWPPGGAADAPSCRPGP